MSKPTLKRRIARIRMRASPLKTFDGAAPVGKPSIKKRIARCRRVLLDAEPAERTKPADRPRVKRRIARCRRILWPLPANVALITNSSIFDLGYYQQNTGLVFCSLKSGIEHFLTTPSNELQAPNFWFDPAFYLSRNPDLEKSGENPLIHYLTHGYRNCRDPHAFLSISYLNQFMSEIAEPIRFYNEQLENNNQMSPCPGFLASEYKKHNQDLHDKFDVAQHYLEHGVRESRCLYGNMWHFNIEAERQMRSSGKPGNTKGSWKYGRILLTSHDASRSGAPLIILKIGQLLAEQYHLDVTFILIHGGELYDDFAAVGQVVCLNEINNSLDFFSHEYYLRLLLKSLKLDKSTIAFCNSAESHSLISAISAVDVPVISLVHEFAEPYPREILNNIQRFSKEVVLPSNLIKTSFEAKLGSNPNNLTITSQGVFDPSFPNISREDARLSVIEELGLNEDTFIVLGSGYVDYRKGCDFFINTAKELFLRSPDANVKFVWLGEIEGGHSNQDYIQWLKNDLLLFDLLDKVLFIGVRSIVDSYFAAADTFLMLSRRDPFPCVVLEAMAARLPVILFDKSIGSVDAFNHKTDSGIVVNYGDVNGVVSSINRLISDAKYKVLVGENAASVISKHYQYPNYVNNLVDKAKSQSVAFNSLFTQKNSNKIFFILPALSISGVVTVTQAFVKHLNTMGWDAKILFTSHRAQVEAHSGKVDQPHVILFDREPSTMERCERIYGFLENQGPCNAVFTFDYAVNGIVPALSDDICAINWVQSDDVEYYEQSERIGRYFDAQICVSEAIAQNLSLINPLFDEKSIVVRNTTIFSKEINMEKKVSYKQSNKVRLIYTGRLEQYQKRVRDFVTLVYELENKSVNYELVIVGYGSEYHYLADSLASQISSGKVILTGSLSAKDVKLELAKSDIFILLSDFEGMPLSLVEAMAHGCVPIVRKMNSGIPELVENGVNGIIINSDDYRDWAKEIATLSSNNSPSGEYSKNAIEKVLNGFTVEASVDHLISYLHSVLDKKNSTTRPRPLTWNSTCGDFKIPHTFMK